ncbi:MAG: hypothetical protein ROR55_27865 [Devosia sp.]
MIARLFCLLALTALLVAPSPTRADDFDEVFANTLRDLFINLSCRSPDGRTDVMFVGIAMDNPTMSKAVRDDINSRAFRAVNTLGEFRANFLEGMNLIATLAAGRDAGVAIRRALAERHKAPVIIFIQARRPAPNVVALRVEASCQEEAGAGYVNTQQATLFVDVDTLDPVDRPKDLDLMTLQGALTLEMTRLGRLKLAQSVDLEVDSSLSGICSLPREVEFVGKSVLSNIRLSRDTLSGPLSTDELVLKLQVWSSDIAPSVVSLGFTLDRDGQTLASTQRRIIVDPSLLAGCTSQISSAASQADEERKERLAAIAEREAQLARLLEETQRKLDEMEARKQALREAELRQEKEREAERTRELEEALRREREQREAAEERERAYRDRLVDERDRRAPPAAVAAVQPRQTYHFVTNLNPRGDNWLALRRRPSTRTGGRLAKLGPNTLLVATGRRSGRWMEVDVPSQPPGAQRGWVFDAYVGCCR